MTMPDVAPPARRVVDAPGPRSVLPAHLGDFEVNSRVLLIAVLAMPLGALSAGVAFVLLRLIGLLTNLVFYGRVDTTLVAPGAVHHPAWLILAAPVVGGLVVGVMARYGSEKIRGHGMPEAIEAILTGGSRIAPRVAVLKPISAAITIGTGGPFGAEGPIIMTGGAVGSLMAQFLRLTADERKALLVAGAAAGMAATFNAPLASVLLAVELLLFEWRPRSFIPVVAAVAVATLTRYSLLGSAAVFVQPDIPFTITPLLLGLCVVSGVTGGALALVATQLVYLSEDLFKRLPIHWMWWPAIGGLIIGLGGLAQPRALGVGYDVIRDLLSGTATTQLVLSILAVKTLIWSVSLGSGTSGGVLAPVFMIGGSLGALEGHLFPAAGASGFWALMGLAGVVGGVMRSPLTGVVFALELTHEWSTLLPLLVTASAAYLVSVLLLRRSVLTEKVARRGFHLSREYSVDPLEVLFVREVMTISPIIARAQTPLVDAVGGFVSEEHQVRNRQHRQRLYPVLDDSDRLVGVVTRRDMLGAALAAPDPTATVASLMVCAPSVCFADDTLRAVASRMADLGVSRMPVVERTDGAHVIGMVTLVDLLQGRLRDLDEERIMERMLHLRVRVPSSRGWRRGTSRTRGEHRGPTQGGGRQ